MNALDASEAPDELRRRFDAAPMSRAQVLAVALTVALSALDGYDVLSVTFAAPAISADWNIGKAALGIVLSSGLAGMALGSIALAPLADVWGRRKLILASLVLMALGMLFCGLAQSLTQLALFRVVTGLGIGTCVAVINPLAAEFSNARRRALSLAMMAMGFPAGGVIGGLLAAFLIRAHGWPAVFFAGFVAAVVLLPIVALLLPESLAFLASRRERDSLARVNAQLARFGLTPVSALPSPAPAGSRGYAGIFARAQRATTARLTAANLFFVVAVYYVLSWLPQMVSDAGFDASTASLVSAVANLVGIVGGLVVGALARYAGLQRLTIGVMVGLGLSTMAFGFAPGALPVLLLAAGVCGFFLYGGAAGFFATLATAFAAESRASGSGFVIGVGRVGSAIAPSLAGWLFASGLGRAEVSAAFGCCALLAGGILALERGRSS